MVDLKKPFDNKRQSFYFLLDDTGHVIRPLDYYFISTFHGGLAEVIEPRELGYISGFINTKGDLEIPLRYSNVGRFSEGLAWIGNASGGSNGYINDQGEVMISSPDYLEGHAFSEGLAAVRMQANSSVGTAQSSEKKGISAGAWGYIDKTGKVVIKPRYDKAEDFQERLAAVKENGKWHFINKDDHRVSDDEFDQVHSFSEGRAAVCKNQKWGYISSEGKIVIPLAYDEASTFSEGLAAIKYGGKVGFINRTGQLLIPEKFTEAGTFKEGLCPVTSGGKWAYIRHSGIYEIAPRFDHADSFAFSRAAVQIGQFCGFIDRSGQFIVKPEYEYAYPYCGDVTVARKKNWQHPIVRAELINAHLQNMKVHKDEHSLTGVYIPSDLDEALKELMRSLPEKAEQDIKDIGEPEMVSYQNELGSWMRTGWGLRGDSRLAQYFKEKGIEHPDDMSEIILDSLWRKVHNSPIELETQIAKHKSYWDRLRPIVEERAQLPEELLDIELKDSANKPVALKEIVDSQDLTLLALCKFDGAGSPVMETFGQLEAATGKSGLRCITVTAGEPASTTDEPARFRYFAPREFFTQVGTALRLEPMVIPQTLLIKKGGLVVTRFNGIENVSRDSIEETIKKLASDPQK